MLDEDLGAEQLVERGVAVERVGRRYRGEPAPCLEHVDEGRRLKAHMPIVWFIVAHLQAFP